MDRQRGTVKWFSREKGWGFIQLQSGEDIFVHHSDVIGEGFVTLDDGEAVEFSVEEMEKGPRAREVRSLADGDRTEREERSRGQEAGESSRGGARSGRSDAERDAEPDEDGDASSTDSGGLRPLAAQLREKLGRHFPGLGG